MPRAPRDRVRFGCGIFKFRFRKQLGGLFVKTAGYVRPEYMSGQRLQLASVHAKLGSGLGNPLVVH